MQETLSRPKAPLTSVGGSWRWWTLAAMCMSLFMTFLDSTVVVVALPSIQRDLHAGIDDLQWVINGYTLVIGVLLVTGGRFGDLFGRKRVLMLGIAVFTIGSACGGFTRDVHFLIAARAIQGLGGAMMVPGTLSIITHSFEGPERGLAIGIWSGVSGLALSLGPVLGGILVEQVSWQSIFYINIPIGLVALVVSWLAVRESRDETSSQRVDVPGLLLLSGGLVSLTLGAIEGNKEGWRSPLILGLLAGATVLLFLFIAVERRVRGPLLDLGFFRSKTFFGANIAAFTTTFATFSFYFFITLYMQDVLGYDALQTGLRLLPQAALMAIVPPLAGKLTDRYGSRIPLTVGQVLLMASLLLAASASVSSGYLSLVPVLILSGIGMGLSYTPMSAAVMGAVSRQRSGGASGVMNTMRQVGGTMGVAAGGAFFSHQVAVHFEQRAHGIGLSDAVGHALGMRVSGAGVGVAASLPPDIARQVAAAARSAFVAGYGEALIVNAVVVAIGVLSVWFFVRPTATDAPGVAAESRRSERAEGIGLH